MGIVFVGGNLALDFVGTLNERFSSRVEQLRAPADLGQWLVAAGVLDRAPEVSEDDLTGAIALREVLFAVIAREIDGAAPRLTGAERAMINAAAAVLAPDPGTVQRWRWSNATARWPRACRRWRGTPSACSTGATAQC